MKLFSAELTFMTNEFVGRFRPPSFHMFLVYDDLYSPFFFGEPRECFFADTKKKWTAIN